MKITPVLLLLLAIFCTHPAKAETGKDSSSCRLRISLLTCSPGEELYSSFGHTAIRVTDSARGMDIVFNYGTFDDSDPQFYVKFTKGLMRYALSAYPFSDFLQEYAYFGRGVVEQELHLSCAEKQTLFNALKENNTEANRFYNYFFYTDNCTTRARDMITKFAGDSVTLASVLPEKPVTYRNLIHQYLDAGHQPWSKFGIDILLGSHLDEKADNRGAMFLPDYLMKGMDKASMNGKPLVSNTNTLLPATAVSGKEPVSPVMVFAIMLLIITAMSVMNKERTNKFLLGFDFIFFLFLGLLGTLLLTLWTIRVDEVCRNNFNLLWALPTHLIVAPVLLFNARKIWIRKYFRTVCIIAALVLLAWFFLPQQLNPAIAPILGLILVRAFYRSK